MIIEYLGKYAHLKYNSEKHTLSFTDKVTNAEWLVVRNENKSPIQLFSILMFDVTQDYFIGLISDRTYKDLCVGAGMFKN